MRPQCPTSGLPSGRHRLRTNDAFSLIELMVVVTILSLLFLIAVPTYQRLQRKAKTAALINDFRTFSTAFQTHAHEKGVWPPDALEGEVPVGMTPEELKYVDWTRMTPIGGKFNWEHNQIHAGTQYSAAITISPTSDAPLLLDDELIMDIDRAIDDGDIDNGNFIRGYGGRPLYVIEK